MSRPVAAGQQLPMAARRKWRDDDTFATGHFTFRCSVSRFDLRTTDESVVLLKNEPFLKFYDELLAAQPRRIFEIGFFEGGMPLYLADTRNVEKIVAIDRSHPSAALLRQVERAGLSNKIRFYGGVEQQDGKRLRQIMDAEFDEKSIDLIIDDCSHQYAETKSAFEACFGYLAPGDIYAIEDWGWAHWPAPAWQRPDSQYAGQLAMTNLCSSLSWRTPRPRR